MDYKSELKAHEAGDKLVKTMREATGLPWEKRVWQNLGWFASATLKSDVGNFSVSQGSFCYVNEGEPKYYTYASPDCLGGHVAYLGNVPSDECPVACFQKAIDQIKAQMNKMKAFYEFATTKHINGGDEGLNRIINGEVGTIKDENGTIIGFKGIE